MDKKIENMVMFSSKFKEEREYWTKKLSGEIGIPKFRMGFNDISKKEHETKSYSCEFHTELSKKIIALSNNSEFGVYIILLSTVSFLLNRYSGCKDIILGVPLLKNENRLDGFNKILPLRLDVNDDITFKQLLVYVAQEVKVVYKLRNFPIQKIFEVTQREAFNDINNLFETVVLLENIHSENKINEVPSNLLFYFMIKDNKIELEIKYNFYMYEESQINQIKNHMIYCLENLMNNFNSKLYDVKLLNDKEINQILHDFNDTKVDYPKDKTIHELFEAQVEKTPDNIAVVFEDRKLTYRELNEKSNSLARVLRNKGVKADSIVGIMVEKSLEMIIGIMGILKAGGAYLPLDPKLPKERINYMIVDSGINVLVTSKKLTNNIEFYGEMLYIEDDNLFKASKENLEIINKCSDLVYIIYTSGTTGNPKGVMVEHNNVVRLMFNEKMPFEFSDKDVWTMFHSYCFDFSVWEMYGALLYGGKLVVVPALITKDFEEYLALLKREKVTVLNQTPSAFYNLMSIELDKKGKDLNLRYIVFGGEALNPQMLKKWKQIYNETKIINMYGITETTVHVTYKEIGIEEIEKGISNIGKPIPTLTTYVIDENLNIQPIGVPGELCVGGDGVARGYLNKDELTKQKFIMNPYIKNERIYRSGDLVRLLENGDLEYLGRIDSQVKIRGFRIELSEIENKLLQHKDVKEATVVVGEDKDNDKYICAYIVSDKEINELNLRDYLKERLPEYMVPSYFLQLEKMPITSNGKLDRKALPKPNSDKLSISYEAPRNQMEEALVKIWSEVLDVNKVGINDNFFELGGHSLKAMILISKIHKETNKEVPLKELFKSPTIKEISKFIENAEENIYSNIEKIKEKKYYEASSAQKRMYIIQEFNKESIAYNMPQVFEIKGSMNKAKIEDTFRKLVERHEALRTYFQTVEDEIVQKIDNNYEFNLKNETSHQFIEEIANDFVRPFDLAIAPLFRCKIVKTKGKTYLLIDMHHIISDGVSMNILINEFTILYNGGVLQPLKLQYKDYAVWQNNFLKSEKMKKQEEYWITMFDDEIPVLNIPTDYERSSVQSFEGDSVSFKVDKNVTLELKELTRKTGTTMHMVLLSAFNILLSKYSGQEDIIVGTPISGRPHADIENIMGMFVNTLALRNKPEGDKKYINFLNEVKENSLKAYDNQSYQLEALIEKLDIVRDTSRNPLFDVMFSMVNTVSDIDIKLNDISLVSYGSEDNIAKFDLTLSAMEQNDEIAINIGYCSKLFNKETIERLSSHYLRILDNISNNKEIKLSEIDLLSEKEKNKILYDFNNTKVDYPKDKTIHELFEAQVEKTPDNIAVVFEDRKLTYRELNERANSLGRVLRDKGVKADSIVAIMVERSIEMIVGIMGILKAGGAYLPIDSDYPKDRIKYMLKDSGSKILLSSQDLLEDIEFNGEIIDLFKEELFNREFNNLEKINNLKNLAYIIYTSGTTGVPKGVAIEHRGIINLTNIFKKDFRINIFTKILQFANIAFDASAWEIYMSVLLGAELHILNKYTLQDISKLNSYIKNNNIDVITVPPFVGNAIEVENSNLKIIITAGSESKKTIVSKLSKKLRYINAYGPTENTICTTMWEYEDNLYKTVPIGKPISNTKAYIINKNNNILPIGIAGEVCVSGEGLARGYLNRTELTEEKFVDNPFELGTKMYKTGDLARWLPDGNIEFLGRIDNQVKIRGFRIELGEIESKILQNKYVKESVVLVDEGKDNDKYICAYIVSDKEINELNLRDYLKESLPEYMVPSYFVKLDKIPITSNGKLDRKALPKPNLDEILASYEAPRNELEVKLSAIWGNVLRVHKVGINDNFFELGGHSLNAIVIISKIHKELNVEVPLREIFKSPTIKEISLYINIAEKNNYKVIPKLKEQQYYTVSRAQKRLFILNQLNKQDISYNMPMILMVEGMLDIAKLERSIKNIINRHEIFRTYFDFINGEPVQIVDKKCAFKINIINIDDSKVEDTINELIVPFNLSIAPLLRASYIKTKKGINILMIDMHHIVSDGLSMRIFIRELIYLYKGNTLNEIEIQYKDYSSWQNNYLNSEHIKKLETYWIEKIKDFNYTDLPKKYDMSSKKNDCSNIEIYFNKEQYLNIDRFCKSNSITKFTYFTSILNIILMNEVNKNDIAIGIPVSGRNHEQLKNTIGIFLNVLLIRTNIDKNKMFKEYLHLVNETLIEALNYQDYPYEELHDIARRKYGNKDKALFSIMLNYIPYQDDKLDENMEIEGVTFKSYNKEKVEAKYDITFYVNEGKEDIFINMVYKNVFEEYILERIAGAFHNISDVVLNNEMVVIKDIKYSQVMYVEQGMNEVDDYFENEEFFMDK